MQPIDSSPSTSSEDQFDGEQSAATRTDETPKQRNSESWDVEGDGFILKGYRPPGQQMALGRKSVFSLPS